MRSKFQAQILADNSFFDLDHELPGLLSWNMTEYEWSAKLKSRKIWPVICTFWMPLPFWPWRNFRSFHVNGPVKQVVWDKTCLLNDVWLNMFSDVIDHPYQNVYICTFTEHCIRIYLVAVELHRVRINKWLSLWILQWPRRL